MFPNVNPNDRERMYQMGHEWLKHTQESVKAFTEKMKQHGTVPKSVIPEPLALDYTELTVEVKFIKTHPDAQLPSKAYSDGDNCFDLFCCEETIVPPSQTTYEIDNPQGYAVKVGSALVPVGLKVAYITPGFGFVVKDKSGLGFKHQLSHYGGEIDNGYRGDMGIKIANYSDQPYTFRKGDKVAQIKIEKIWKAELSFTDEIVEAECPRGEGGFGSSGK